MMEKRMNQEELASIEVLSSFFYSFNQQIFIEYLLCILVIGYTAVNKTDKILAQEDLFYSNGRR